MIFGGLRNKEELFGVRRILSLSFFSIPPGCISPLLPSRLSTLEKGEKYERLAFEVAYLFSSQAECQDGLAQIHRKKGRVNFQKIQYSFV